MKFESQICTTKEQSERLLALGLKKETADMYITDMSSKGINYTDDWQIGTIPYCKVMSFSFWGSNLLQLGKTAWSIIPAWSLHRLIEMYTEHYVCEHINLKLLTYDTIIENIRLDISTGTFNKDYLEQ